MRGTKISETTSIYCILSSLESLKKVLKGASGFFDSVDTDRDNCKTLQLKGLSKRGINA